MGFLELAGIVLVLGVALPVCVGVIREVAGAVDIAEAASAKAGIMAAIGKTAVTKARAAAGKAPAVKLTAAVKAAETAATAETECADLLGPDRNARGDGRQQRDDQPISTRKLPDNPYPPGATLRP